MLSYFWFGFATPVVPMGYLIAIVRLSSVTGANTWRGRFSFGRKLILASLLSSLLGFVMHAGLFMPRPGVIQFHLF